MRVSQKYQITFAIEDNDPMREQRGKGLDYFGPWGLGIARRALNGM